jgi:hypothetical protein
MAATLPTELCHAPKILSTAPCGRRVATPGTRLCTRHLGTDPERRCQSEGRERLGNRVTCYAWPLVGLPYCAAHDPEELQRRREARAARAAGRAAMARGRELLTTTPPEILLLSGRVTAAEIETAVWRSRWLRDNVLPAARPRPPASMDQPSSPIAWFVCPLCFEESGQRVRILAEYDLSTPLVTVGDLIGCPHAQRFGQVGGLTVDEERRLIDAALAMWEAHQREEGQAEDDDRADSNG